METTKKRANFILVKYYCYVVDTLPYCVINILCERYCKQQKLSDRKVSQLTGFHSNVRETFVGFASVVLKILKKAIAHKMHQQNFCILSNLRKPQNFSLA